MHDGKTSTDDDRWDDTCCCDVVVPGGHSGLLFDAIMSSLIMSSKNLTLQLLSAKPIRLLTGSKRISVPPIKLIPKRIEEVIELKIKVDE